MRSSVVRLLGVVALTFGGSLFVASTAGAVMSSGPCENTTSVGPSGVSVCQTFQIKHVPLRRLEAVVKQQAAMLGEHHSTHAAVVISTRREATTLTGSIENEDTPIYFVQAQGHFTCGARCTGPSGATPVTGSY